MADDSPQNYRRLFGVDVPDNLEPIKIILENSGENKTAQFDQDDIIDETKVKLGDHAAKITKDAGNFPTLKNGSKEVFLRTPSGNPKPIIDDDSSANTTFSKELEKANSNVTAKFKEISDSKFLEPNDDLKLNLAKGKVDDKTRETIYDVLKDVEMKLGDSKIAKIIQERQSQDNRNNPEKYYLHPENSLEEDESNVGNAYLQDQLGIFIPKKWPSVPNNSEEATFKIKNLKNLGIQILMESSGEYYVPEDTDNFGQVILAKAASTAPGIARMGLKVRTNRFSAGEIAGQVKSKFDIDSKFPSLKDNFPLSHGSVNNPLVPFNAVSSTHSEAAAILLAATIGGLLKALALAVDKFGASALTNPVASIVGSLGKLGKAGSTPTKTDREYRVERMGKYTHSKSPTEDEEKNRYSLGGLIVVTENDYVDCVKKGFEVFFDAPSGGPLNQLKGAGLGAANAATGGLLGALGIDTPYDKIADAPGYYSTILRMIIKSATSDIMGLVGSISGLFGSSDKVENFGAPGPLDVNKSIGLDKDPTNILNSLSSLQESKVVKFMNILATIGDLSLNLEDSVDSIIDHIPDNNDPDSASSNLDDVDVLLRRINFPNPAALVRKNRLSDLVGAYQGNLSWGSNTLRSLYLLPETTIKAENFYNNSSDFSSVINTNLNFIKASATGRLQKELVDEIENELDSYYMPFYFHDLRTNEIISFHAFTEDLNDSFDAEYNETEGFGRIGKVYTYKNTNRSISFSFRAIATNENDFSEMWYKINRLLLMLYPQYSAGRSVENADGSKFIQPFSQVITNSPLVRVRLGDLFKTNFSEIDLARLFGAGTNKFSINKTTQEPNEVVDDQENLNKISETKRYILARDWSQFKPGDRMILDPSGPNGSKTPRHRSIMEPKGKKMISLKQIPSTKWRVEYEGPDPISDTHFLVKVISDASLSAPASLPSRLTLHKGSREEVGYSLTPDEADLLLKYPPKKTIPGATNTEVLSDADQVKEFFDSSKNPIMKSFESTSGQGLAGYIKKIAFDWSDARWETEGLNNRAPMWCKLSVDFAPIYDLNPGLDVNGEPIGMPYNIGSILKLIKRSKNKDKELIRQKVYNDNRGRSATIVKEKEKIDENEVKGAQEG